MAKKASAKADKPKADKPKSKKNKGSEGSTRKAGGASSKSSNAAEALMKLAEHPIVADLIAVGATAAVAAIVKSKSDTSNKAGSGRAVKNAGKAAAAAIGARLVEEFKAVKQSAKSAQSKN